MRVACLKHDQSDINSFVQTPQAKAPDWLHTIALWRSVLFGSHFEA